MEFKELLNKYAKLIVNVGVNIQKGQMLIVNGSVTSIDLAREIALEAYKSGASKVQVKYNDEILSRYALLYQSDETLKEVPEWFIDERLYAIEKGAAMVSITSPNPKAMEGVNPEKMKISQQAVQAHPKFQDIMAYTMGNRGQWCVVAMPSDEWAKKVFPALPIKEAYEQLWLAILKASRVSKDNDPVAAWAEHNSNISRRSKIMNEHNFKSLHYKNSLGTDFDVELVNNHIWAGGSEHTTKGIVFNPNIPTEEVFTMPLKTGVNGKIFSTKPLFYNGKLIEDFWFEFKDGKVVDFGAKKEYETLKNLVENDPGSCYLGEVALVQYDSPISNSGILFYNTLFDENASCHLALGNAYPMNVKGGTSMSREQLKAAGANSSFTHVDFMVGSKDLDIVGTKHDGSKVQIFKNGNFVF
ncbi:MAG: aminopeptidase [Bacilli bacterium]|nr:aminopeptidase [Bacilli bacterium]